MGVTVGTTTRKVGTAVGTIFKVDFFRGPNALEEEGSGVGGIADEIGGVVCGNRPDEEGVGVFTPSLFCNFVEKVHGTPPLSYFVSPIRI